MKKLLFVVLLVILAGPACAQYRVGELEVTKNVTFLTSNDHAIRFTRPTTGIGTVAITSGFPTVTGTATKFTEWFSDSGLDQITINGQTCTVNSITSDTELSACAPGDWSSTGSGLTYTPVALTANAFGVLPNSTLRLMHNYARILFQEPTGGDANLSKLVFRTEDGVTKLSIAQNGVLSSIAQASFTVATGDQTFKSTYTTDGAAIRGTAGSGSETVITGHTVGVWGSLNAGVSAVVTNAAVRGSSFSTAATTGVFGESTAGISGYFKSYDTANTSPTVVIAENSSGQTAGTKLLELRKEDGTAVWSVDVDGNVTGTGSTVLSVFGRTGAVTALQADYDSFFTTTAEAASAAPVQSVFGRTGTVAATQADYDSFFLTQTEGDTRYAETATGNTFLAPQLISSNTVDSPLRISRGTSGVGDLTTGSYTLVLEAASFGVDMVFANTSFGGNHRILFMDDSDASPRSSIVSDGTSGDLVLSGGGVAAPSQLTIGVSGTTITNTASSNAVAVTDADVAHGMTDIAATSTYGSLDNISETDGGLQIIGASDADAAGMWLRGYMGSTNPTDTTAAMLFSAGKKNGTTVQALANSETAFQFANNATNLVTIYGDGDVSVGATGLNSGKIESFASGGVGFVSYNTAAAAIDTGGRITFGGKQAAAGTYGAFASIAGLKENATDDNNAGYLRFDTRTNGGSFTERLRLSSTGAATFTSSVAIGSGTPITKHLSATASLDYAQALATTCEVLTVAVTGAADGDSVNIGVPHALANHNTTSTFFAWVSASNTVSVRRCVISADGSNPAAATVRADVWVH